MAIRETTEGFFNAWNAGDIKELVSHWADDATVINPLGRVAHGKVELERLFSDEHRDHGNTKEKILSISTRFLSERLAWADVDLVVNGVDSSGQVLPESKFHLAGLLRKDQGQWLWLEGRPYMFAQKAQ